MHELTCAADQNAIRGSASSFAKDPENGRNLLCSSVRRRLHFRATPYPLCRSPRWRANCRIDRGTSDADCHDRCGEVGAAKIQDPTTARDRLSVGMIALTLMLFFEFTLVLKLRGLTLAQYFRERDPVSGVLYYLMLGMFALLSLLIGRERSSEEVRERRV